MNNEDKILAILEQLSVGQTRLEAGQIAMQADINRLDIRVEDIHQTLAKLEIENEQAHGGIHDKLDIIENKTDVLIEHQPIIVNLLENYDLRLKRLEKRVLAG